MSEEKAPKSKDQNNLIHEAAVMAAEAASKAVVEAGILQLADEVKGLRNTVADFSRRAFKWRVAVVLLTVAIMFVGLLFYLDVRALKTTSADFCEARNAGTLAVRHLLESALAESNNRAQTPRRIEGEKFLREEIDRLQVADCSQLS